MWLFNRVRKIKRSDVVDQIIAYEKEMEDLEDDILSTNNEIEDLFQRGKTEKNVQMRELLASKIAQKKKSITTKMKRIKFLQYNITILENLKVALDDMEFSKEKKNNPINDVLRHSKDLNDFLARSNANRNQLEQSLVSASATFDEYESLMDAETSSGEIYGTNEKVSDIMAQFEMDSDLEEDEFEQSIGQSSEGEIKNE